MQFQDARATAAGDGIKPRALDEHIFGRERNLGVGAAHNSANTLGTRTVAVGNHAHAGIERAFDAVERFDFFSGLRFPGDEFVVADLVVVVGVNRLAQFKHHVVRNIDDVADTGDAARFEPLAEPWWRRLNLHATNDARGEAPAEFGRLNLDL